MRKVFAKNKPKRCLACGAEFGECTVKEVRGGYGEDKRLGYEITCSAEKAFDCLTLREQEVLRAVCCGYIKYKQLAELLTISPFTAKTHLQNIRNKTGLGTMAELALYGTRNGL